MNGGCRIIKDRISRKLCVEHNTTIGDNVNNESYI